MYNKTTILFLLLCIKYKICRSVICYWLHKVIELNITIKTFIYIIVLPFVFQSRIGSTSLLRRIIIFNRQKPQFPVSCSDGNLTKACSSYYPTNNIEFGDDLSSTSCPEYFRWIHEDLKPWKKTGITREMIEKGKNISHIRLVIINGKAYIEKHGKVFQTRDIFTIWGILQLLRLYPGKIPDLELMFQCGDKTIVNKKNFQESQISPPPVFHYCGDENSYDIVFPDWTFWGW